MISGVVVESAAAGMECVPTMSEVFKSGIRPRVDEWLLREAAKTRDYGEYWSASSAGYCMRKVIFERLKVPYIKKDDDARKQRVFTSGHLFHEWLQRITKEAGLSIAQEIELLDDESMIKGHIDDLVLVTESLKDNNVPAFADYEGAAIPPKQHLILYDYKTVNSQSFKYKKEKMSYYHRMQLGTYMMMLRKNKPELNEARILLISKDDLRMAEQVLIWDAQLGFDVAKYWDTLNKYWKERKLPDCTCADNEGGFMASEKWNPYFYDGEPCSLKYYKEWKLKNDVV